MSINRLSPILWILHKLLLLGTSQATMADPISDIAHGHFDHQNMANQNTLSGGFFIRRSPSTTNDLRWIVRVLHRMLNNETVVSPPMEVKNQGREEIPALVSLLLAEENGISCDDLMKQLESVLSPVEHCAKDV